MDAPAPERRQRQAAERAYGWVGRRVLGADRSRDRRGRDHRVAARRRAAPARRRAPGPEAVVILHSWRALWRLATGGSAGWYEAWAAGEWESPDPVALFELFTLNRHTLAPTGAGAGGRALAAAAWHRARRNDRAGARRNIVEHYDLGNDFYELWLDPSMTYSSAMFAAPDQSLEEAQRTKLRAILDRTGCEPGDRILEIGCGWGSFAEEAARAGVTVHGITLSTEQKAYAEARLARQGLAGEIELTDYRDVAGTYRRRRQHRDGRGGRRRILARLSRRHRPRAEAGRARGDPVYRDRRRDVSTTMRATSISSSATSFPAGCCCRKAGSARSPRKRGWRGAIVRAFGLDYAETLRRWRERVRRGGRRRDACRSNSTNISSVCGAII